MFRKGQVKNFIVSFLICIAFMSLCADKTLRGADSENQSSVLDLLRRYQTKQDKATTSPAKERVVHFPKDRSLGTLNIQDVNTPRYIDTFFYWTTQEDIGWKYFGQAKGDVMVPGGKRIMLNSDSADLSPLNELRPDDLFALNVSGSRTGGPKLGDKSMEYISRLTDLRRLGFGRANISSRGMRLITSLECLEYLVLPESIDEAGLAYVSELPNIKFLYFKQNRVTDAGLQHIAKLSSLEELDLGGERMTDSGLACLTGLPSLQYLSLWGNFTDAGMAQLQKVPSLRIVVISIKKFTDVGLKNISGLPRLENISLHWMEGITDQGMIYLKNSPSLKKLDISHSQVTDAGLAHLRGVKTLEYLDLPRKGISDVGLSYLGELANLRHLDIARVHYVDPNRDKGYYTDKGVAELAKCKLLEKLTIGSIGITDAGMDHIAKLTNLKKLFLFGCTNVTNKGLAKLTALKSLQNLDVHDANLTIGGLSSLNRLPNLVTLSLHGVQQDDAGLDLSKLTKLDNLSLYTKAKRVDKHKQQIVRELLHDNDLTCLSKLTQLTILQVSHGGITDNGLKHLSGLTNLGRLSVGGEKITDKGLLHLTNMSKLDSLTLTGKFTDEALIYLERLPTLTTLDIMEGANFSPAAVQRFRRNMPELVTFRPNMLSAMQQQPGQPKPAEPPRK